MKKMMICAAMLAAMCGLVSCGEENEQPAEGSRTGFALKFLKNVAATVPAAENVVISPYSAGVALSMVAEGAEGQTRVEFDKFIRKMEMM